MASGIDKLAKQIARMLKNDSPTGYDTTATVTRVEGGTAWVHIPGGVDETPVRLTINAKSGDNVQVRVSNGRAFLIGNGTAPPTDDVRANEAFNFAGIANTVARKAGAVADRAFKIAGNTAQYFWVTEEGTDTGAHITEKPQEEFLEDPANGGPNLLLRSIGIAIRQGLVELASFSASGLHVTSGNGTAIAHLGYGPGNAQSGTADAPYYTLGIRAPEYDIGNYSVAEGETIVASKYCSHAEGTNTQASGVCSHAEGALTRVFGNYSHAEGFDTEVSGERSHAGGYGTTAAGDDQTVIGRYNVADANDQYAFIIGKGYYGSPSNALTVDWNGYLMSRSLNDNVLRYPIQTGVTDGQRIAYQSCDSSKFYVNGQFGSTGAYSVRSISFPSSDVRLKKNVEDCSVDALELINQIKLHQFDWKNTNEHQKIGFIADELEQLDSKLAMGGGWKDDKTMSVKSVDTFYLLGYLVKAVQELSAEVEELRRETNGNHSGT